MRTFASSHRTSAPLPLPGLAVLKRPSGTKLSSPPAQSPRSSPSSFLPKILRQSLPDAHARPKAVRFCQTTHVRLVPRREYRDDFPVTFKVAPDTVAPLKKHLQDQRLPKSSFRKHPLKSLADFLRQQPSKGGGCATPPADAQGLKPVNTATAPLNEKDWPPSYLYLVNTSPSIEQILSSSTESLVFGTPQTPFCWSDGTDQEQDGEPLAQETLTFAPPRQSSSTPPAFDSETHERIPLSSKWPILHLMHRAQAWQCKRLALAAAQSTSLLFSQRLADSACSVSTIPKPLHFGSKLRCWCRSTKKATHAAAKPKPQRLRRKLRSARCGASK
ncbi:hypothetical protein RI367_001707 [Sorochytrium milnesiophthora]